jgi:hypothetical protein
MKIQFDTELRPAQKWAGLFTTQVGLICYIQNITNRPYRS